MSTRQITTESAPRLPECVITRGTRLYYTVGTTSTRLAFVHAAVNGVSTVLLVDSGATDHVLASWFVERWNIDSYTNPDDVAVDHDGERIRARRAANVRLSLDGWGHVATSDPFVIDLPSIFAENGIGGILAPQLLRRAGARLVLDLVGGSIALESGNCASSAAESPHGCALTAAPIESCAPDARGVGPLFALPTTINGIVTMLVLDTGARESDVFASSRTGGELTSVPGRNPTDGYVISGRSPGISIPSVNIQIGSCTFSESIILDSGAPGKLCRQDGVLGIDVLRSCILAIDDRGLTGVCRSPTESPAGSGTPTAAAELE